MTDGASFMDGRASLLEIAVRLRMYLVALGVVCVVGALVVAVVLPPVYRAEVIVLPVSPEAAGSLVSGLASQLGVLGSLAGLDAAGNSMKEEALATLQSRAFTEEFIVERNLLPRLYYKDWNAQKLAWNLDDKEIPSLWEAKRLFDEEVRSVTENRRSGLVTVAIEWIDPQEAADWANDLVRRANSRMRHEAVQEAQKSLVYLNRELEQTSVLEVREAVFRLIESQTHRIMIANVREDYAFKVIDPAKAPDVDGYIRPRRALIVAGGALLAVFLGLAIVLVVTTFTDLSNQASRKQA